MTDLRTALQSVYDQHRQLTPKLLVDVARDPEHPLHNRFEWDDTAAGEKWRRHQAHELITSVKVVYKDSGGQPQEVRKWHAIPRESGHVYEPAEEIVQDPLTTKILLASMKREWQTLKKRYEHFEEFRKMVMDDLAGDAA
jgi:hypothetical protein